ncbi:uncharacterized protein LOC135486300 [Lineus longissimus]|uniref:uncharacterized protein LOC135486300 n=1 Tax=Lineus longissimus TaxID=88925 RepID=UPI00315DB55A
MFSPKKFKSATPTKSQIPSTSTQARVQLFSPQKMTADCTNYPSTLEGYIHDVGGRNCITFEIQVAADIYHHVISFQMDSRYRLKAFQKAKAPVSITNHSTITSKDSPDKKDIKLTSSARIQAMPTPPFAHVPPPSTRDQCTGRKYHHQCCCESSGTE